MVNSNFYGVVSAFIFWGFSVSLLVNAQCYYSTITPDTNTCIAVCLFVQDAVLPLPTHLQAARAANVVHSVLQFRRSIEREELNPVSFCGLL